MLSLSYRYLVKKSRFVKSGGEPFLRYSGFVQVEAWDDGGVGAFGWGAALVRKFLRHTPRGKLPRRLYHILKSRDCNNVPSSEVTYHIIPSVNRNHTAFESVAAIDDFI